MDTRKFLTTLVGCAALGAFLDADTLVLRDGRRVEGTLLSVRDGVVEFEARRGFGGRERIRLDRDEVVRIEFDDPRDRPGVDGGRPSGLRERDVRVDARRGWTDTGVEVRAGQTVYFDATGRVRWGPSRQDGPEGEHGSPRNDARPIPSRPAAALIGRVGESTDYFFIGETSEGIRMRGSGRLYLGINDDYLNDNSGAFSVTVLY
jgi:hypothetical protein